MRLTLHSLISLTGDEHIIYNHIAESRTIGCWVKSLKGKTNLHATNLTKVIKSLETKRLIKTIKNVKFPTRRIYMLSELNPSEDVTGGPWFSDAELDVDLVEALADLAIKFVRERSWSVAARTKSRREERERAGTSHAANTEKSNAGHDEGATRSVKRVKKGKQARFQSSETPQQPDGSGKNSTDTTLDNTAATSIAPSAREEPEAPLFPPQPNFQPIPPSISNPNSTHSFQLQATHTYPATAEICAHIRESGVTSLSFNESEFQDLLDMLVWDGRLEKIGPDRYRSVRGTLALTERERSQEKRRKKREDTRKAGGTDIEDLSNKPAVNHKKRTRLKDDIDGEEEDGDDALSGRDWKKYNRLQKKHPPSSTNQAPTTETRPSIAGLDLTQERLSTTDDLPDPEFGGLTNGFAEAPCSRCPVFSICGEGGPVSAASCLYFEGWLGGGMKDYEGLERRFRNTETLKG